ncbi:MAG: DUF4465 domain-containing protein [Sedimentisphaerales bacterium]|nr:DUF4465 domain-containing protein [Sedimentisphaerales bacterium]
MKSIYFRISMIIVFTFTFVAKAKVATFEDMNLPDQSYWDGSDGSGSFTSGGISFSNNYNSEWESWDGFSCSNFSDSITIEQYNCIAGTGQGGTSHYAICYIGFTELPVITLSSEETVYGLYVTNNNTAYYSMLNGSKFSKKFGGSSGSDKDWFKLTVTGKDTNGVETGYIEFYLADYRFDDNNSDYIVNTWEYIDLTSLGKVKTLEFNLSSSDSGDWGMNTPAYFALDTILCQSQPAVKGPYTEAGINGYINPFDNGRHASPQDSQSVINPIFKSWATEAVDYYQTPGVDFRWSNPDKTLGPVTGNVNDIFSLGDLSRQQVKDGESPGWIILTFSEPFGDVNGYDFAVFENGLISESTTSAGSVAGELLAELAFVEVSSNGVDFARFPSVSLTEKPGSIFSTIQPDKVYNLAGKHSNAYDICTGTPFDLRELAAHPDVISGLVDINDVRYVRIVDIPGTGDFYDKAVEHIDLNTDPNWATYENNHPIFDEWDTTLLPLYPSSGFDLEAVGILNEQNYNADFDLNGVVDIDDFNIFVSAWHSSFGKSQWHGRCDLAVPKDNFIDIYDFEVFISQWMKKEKWIIE